MGSDKDDLEVNSVTYSDNRVAEAIIRAAIETNFIDFSHQLKYSPFLENNPNRTVTKIVIQYICGISQGRKKNNKIKRGEKDRRNRGSGVKAFYFDREIVNAVYHRG